MSLVKKLLLLTVCLCVTIAAIAQDETPTVEKAEAGTPVVYMHLETFPYKYPDGRLEKYPLFRELARQSCFVSLREELGLPVRDAVLGEESPSEADVVHLTLLSRFYSRKRTCVVRLYLVDPSDKETTVQDLWKTEPLWEHTREVKSHLSTLVGDTVKAFGKLSREELLTALKKSGLEPVKKSDQSQAKFDKEQAEAMLLEMDFVKQFAVVRRVHEVIQQQGETPELLGMLTRGYANLAMLTELQWNMVSDAFGARALLYAERMVASSDASVSSLWHRMYVMTLIGSHKEALVDLETIKEKSDDTEAPVWTKVLEPFCYCDRTAMRKVVDSQEALSELGRRMLLQIDFIYRYPEHIYESGNEMMEEVPTSYDNYAIMARYGQRLGTKRAGAAYGPMALAEFAPQSLDSLAELPEAVRALLPTTQAKAMMIKFTLPDPDPYDAFSPVPSAVAGKLRRESKKERTGALSWAALAYLLEEEVFVQVANHFIVSTDGTERSLAHEVAGVRTFIQNHPYAKYVESFAIDRRRNRERYVATFDDFEFRDPRAPMIAAMFAVSGIENSKGESLKTIAWEWMPGDPTLLGYTMRAMESGILPRYKHVADYYAWHVRQVAPHCEVWIRLSVNGRKDPTPERLREWEQELKYDPRTFEELGRRFDALKLTDDAKRCYEKALDGMVTKGASIRLASIYLKRGEAEQWKATLNRALAEMEDLGLQHALIHKEFYWGYLNRGMWAEAKPHVLIEADTWSAWGLIDASHICEGLAQWDESEQWIQQACQAYPTGSGYQWYFWCARTGRGDIESARELAERYFEHPSYGTSNDYCVRRGTYRILEERFEDALDSYKKALAETPNFTNSFMVAFLSRQLGDEETATKVLAAKEKAVGELEKKDFADGVGMNLLKLIQRGSITEEELKSMDEQLKKLDTFTRCRFTYYFARQLEADSQKEKADEYYRKALTIPAWDTEYATLSGARLAERLGTSREADDVLDPSDLWNRNDTIP